MTRASALLKQTLPLLLLFFGLMMCASRVQAQTSPAEKSGQTLLVPVFIDPDRRIERRDLPRGSTIRFLSADDYPPFHYLGPDGVLSGFNIDLARAICTELNAQCTVQARRWDGLLPALEANAGDAVIASHRVDAALRRNVEVSSIVYRVPARFAGRKKDSPLSIELAALAGKSVAVVGGSAHEAFLNALFPNVKLVRFANIERALEAMRRAEADLAFGDGVSIAFWMNGSESLDCCAFIGGPFTESRYFGEGTGILLRKGNTDLRQAMDYALWRIGRDGRFAKLYLKHFPIPFY